MTRPAPVLALRTASERPFAPARRDLDLLLTGFAAMLPLGAIEALLDRLEQRP
jgi:hypothetical protein